MSYKQLKWLILLIPTFTVGLWEYVRHEYLLPYISMDLGNWLTPVIVLFVTFTLLTRFFSKLEMMQEQLHREREEKATFEERERIARELHDGLAQSLFLLSVKMKKLQQISVAKEDEQKLQAIQQSVSDIHDYVRTGIENLRHPVTEEINLATEVQAVCKTFSQETNLPVELSLHIDERAIRGHAKKELLFCMKEALINIHKHAEAKQAFVTITINEVKKEMIIKDDGIGFPEDVPSLGHFGIRMMHERCEKINWQLSIERDNGKTILHFLAKGEPM